MASAPGESERAAHLPPTVHHSSTINLLTAVEPTPRPDLSPRTAPAPAAMYEDEMRQRVLDKPIKGIIRKGTEEVMNEHRAAVVFDLAIKFKIDSMKIQEIRDAMAGGGNTTESFLKILINGQSRTSIKEVSETLEELELKAAKEEWDRITEDKWQMSDLELHDVQPMYPHLKHDATLPILKSWIDLADSLPNFPQELIDSLKGMATTGGQYSAAGLLLSHLKRAQITVGTLLRTLYDVDKDKKLTQCKNVIFSVENDIRKAIANEKKKISKVSACDGMMRLSLDYPDSPVFVVADSDDDVHGQMVLPESETMSAELPRNNDDDVRGQMVLPEAETKSAQTCAEFPFSNDDDARGQIVLPEAEMKSSHKCVELPCNNECRIDIVLDSYDIMKELSDKLDRNQNYVGFGEVLLEKIRTLKASKDPDVKAELTITKMDIKNLQFKIYGGGSPAGTFLEYFETRFPDKTIQSLRSCAQQLKRMDVCKLIDGWNKRSSKLDDLTYQEKTDLISHLHKAPGNWKDFASKFGFSMLDIDRMAGSVMQKEKDSPTIKLFESVYQNYPNFKIVHLCDVAKKLGRNDVVNILQQVTGKLSSGI